MPLPAQYSLGFSTDRNLFFTQASGRDLGSFSSYFFHGDKGVSTSGLRYGKDISVRQTQLEVHASLGSHAAGLVQYVQFGNESYTQETIGLGTAIRLGESAGISLGINSERQRFGEGYGKANSYAGIVSIAMKWRVKAYFLGSLYIPLVAPHSEVDRFPFSQFSFGYEIGSQCRITASLRYDGVLHPSASLWYSPTNRVQLVLGNTNSRASVFVGLGMNLGKNCWMRYTTFVQSAWGMSHEIGLAYVVPN
jgi:hypothetical protein